MSWLIEHLEEGTGYRLQGTENGKQGLVALYLPLTPWGSLLEFAQRSVGDTAPEKRAIAVLP